MIDTILLACILGVLVAQNLPAFLGWVRLQKQHAAKRKLRRA
jgi:hypothetical protein